MSLPRGGGESRDQLRLLLLERRGVVQARTAALNQLQAAALTPTLPQRLRTLGGEKLLRACLQLRPTTIEHTIMRRLARRVRQLGAELADVDAQLSTCISSLAPQLTSERGVGVTCAAQLLVSSGDPARMHSEAAFAALAGTSPVDASSGRQQRHRLNRGGDRQLNRALHMIALSRVRHHEQTRSYYHRLLESGKTSRETRRCVKRALTRHFYRQPRTITPPLHT